MKVRCDLGRKENPVRSKAPNGGRMGIGREENMDKQRGPLAGCLGNKSPHGSVKVQGNGAKQAQEAGGSVKPRTNKDPAPGM